MTTPDSAIPDDVIKKAAGLPMQPNDANAGTIGDYLRCLLLTFWKEGESFSSKRPFGNSSWQDEVYLPLVKAGLVPGEVSDDGYLAGIDWRAADKLVIAIITKMAVK